MTKTTKIKIPLYRNMRKVSGDSLEDVLTLLKGEISKSAIIYETEIPKYFRDNLIVISRKDYDNFIDDIIIGSLLDDTIIEDAKVDNLSKGYLSFYAYYIPSKKFDYSNFNGFYAFDKGKLVERTRILPTNLFIMIKKMVGKKLKIKQEMKPTKKNETNP